MSMSRAFRVQGESSETQPARDRYRYQCSFHFLLFLMFG